MARSECCATTVSDASATVGGVVLPLGNFVTSYAQHTKRY